LVKVLLFTKRTRREALLLQLRCWRDRSAGRNYCFKDGAGILAG